MGRPKKSDRVVLPVRVDANTPQTVKEIAAKLGYLYAGEGSVGQLLNAIARGEVILIKSTKGVDTQE